MKNEIAIWNGFVGAICCNGSQLYSIKEPCAPDFRDPLPIGAEIQDLVILTKHGYNKLMARHRKALTLERAAKKKPALRTARRKGGGGK